MKVVYDISVLGMASLFPYVRTGTFRYVENLAYGLANSSECDLSFCALHLFGRITWSSFVLDYLQGNSRLNQVPFLKPPLITTKRFLDHQINQLNSVIDNQNRSRSNHFHLRAVRRLLYDARVMLELVPDPQISKELTKADIFHFPSNSTLPKRIRQTKSLKRFVTIYDLVPILYPHFFVHDSKNLFTTMIDNLEPDDWVICISHSTRNDLLNHFTHIDPSKVVVTHLAASNFFQRCDDREVISTVQKKYGIASDMQYILSVCTLEPRKNIVHVIDSFSRFVQENHIKDVNLVLVGPKGWNYDKIFFRISQEEWLKDRILFTGYVTDEHLAPLYTGALAFVYISLYEGFGLPPLEAMQCGVPVIVSNTSAFPEVVGGAGLTVDPSDQDGLGQALYAIYSSASLREALSRKSLERARLFSWDKCTRETMAAYKMALDS